MGRCHPGRFFLEFGPRDPTVIPLPMERRPLLKSLVAGLPLLIASCRDSGTAPVTEGNAGGSQERWGRAFGLRLHRPDGEGRGGSCGGGRVASPGHLGRWPAEARDEGLSAGPDQLRDRERPDRRGDERMNGVPGTFGSGARKFTACNEKGVCRCRVLKLSKAYEMSCRLWFASSFLAGLL